MIKVLTVVAMVLSLGGCTLVRSVRAIQPSQAVDTPRVWVEVQTNEASANGIYRCIDDGREKPYCVKAELVRP